ncbi:MAG: glycosyltransferase family 39 protein [Candidatus Nanoarchaeia archaeon]|nr:glycosyltransferase family 39 protein [Candidatus Nanoarchaeia archaeon]MDD5587606.1 glycosyltransferase family 39 protein [Candidatus Nanoarchaeia archaeon]
MTEEKKNCLDRVIDFIFSKDYRKYLVLFVIIGGLLRYLLVNSISFLGDEMVHGPHAINIISTNKIGILQQSILWFYLTDIGYKILGVTAFSARFLSFFFGVLSILVLYLVTKEIFSKKTAMVASFLLTISAFTIRFTLIEMDITMIFFLLLATYFFIKELKKGQLSYIAAAIIGIASLIKSIALFFAVGFGVSYIYYKYKTAENKKQILSSKDWGQGIRFTLIILLFFSTVLIFNFLLYQDKGITDTIFAKFFDINKEVYANQAGFNEGFSVINMFVGAGSVIKSVFLIQDPILFILGILGILLIFLHKGDRLWKNVILILMIVPFFIQTGSDLLSTHFVPYIPLLCMFGASFLIFIENKTKKYSKNILPAILLLIFIVNLFFIPIGSPTISHITSKSANIEMRDYAIKNIEDNAIVFVDPRVYGGRTAWMFNDKYYLDASYTAEFNNKLASSAGKESATPIYYIECARDDCGWGTVTDNALNKTSEGILQFFQSNAKLVENIKGGGNYDEKAGESYYNIYKMQILVKPAIYDYVINTHEWFYYPVRYNKESFDQYEVHNFFYRILDIFGHIVLYFAILASLLIPIYLVYLLAKDKEGKDEEEVKGKFEINYKRTLIILGIIFVAFIGIATYLHYSHKSMMVEHCNSLGMDMDHYANGELYCLNKTDSSYRAFYYVGKGLSYEITTEMQLHDEWRTNSK